MKLPALPKTLLLLAAFAAPFYGISDEIVPAASATEDLRSFDESIVLPAAADAKGGIGASISIEARKLRQEGQAPFRESDPTLRRDGKSAAGLSAESNPSNAPKNAGKKPDVETGKKPKR
jgi:hypothetical protein